MQQEDKLQKWHEGLDEVSGWVVKTRVKVEVQQRLATDVDAALEQIDDFQVCCCFLSPRCCRFVSNISFLGFFLHVRLLLSVNFFAVILWPYDSKIE